MLISKTFINAVVLASLSQISLAAAEGNAGSGLAMSNEAVSLNITKKQFYQSRFNFGVNLGSSFIREDWIYPALFPQGVTTELEAITIEAKEDAEAAREKLETHWKSFMLDWDWNWLQERNVNSIRLPIGYWHVDGGLFVEGTRFEQYADIYKNAWTIFKTHYIEPAAKRGISVLVTLHGVPGSANINDHNGEKSGAAELWTNAKYQEIMVKIYAFVAKDLKEYENISGLQLVNEAEWAEPGTAQKQFYTASINAIREHDKDVPIVISDSWNPRQYADWVQEVQGTSSSAGIVVDHHFYKCFTEADKSRSAEQSISDLDTLLLALVKENNRGVDFMVGEWAAVLAPETWTLSGIDPNEKDNQRRNELEAEFGKTEEKLIEERASAGSYFWTYKFEYGSGGGWDFSQQLGRSLEAPVVYMADELTMENALKEALSELGSDAEKEGYAVAWNDAAWYARQGALIGRKQAVKFARMQQHLSSSKLASAAEWEKGYDNGMLSIGLIVRGC